MSSRGSPASSPSTRPPAAIDVSFSRLADQSGESSSQAESRSSGRRSNGSERLSQEVAVPLEDSAHRSTGQERHYESRGYHPRNSGGFLLESVFANGQPGAADRNGKRKAPNGRLHVNKRGAAAARLSMESSHANSPLSREVSAGQVDGHEQEQRPSRPPSMDPAQLVQMALNLSDSRKRHISGPLQVPLPSPKDGRRTSGLGIRKSSARRRASYVGDEMLQDSPSSRRSGTAEVDEREHDRMKPDVGPLDIPTNFSPATVSRVETARKYFELASEHRILLQHLPPLKSDANAPGNHTFVSTSSPHTANPHITRVPSYLDNKHELGRKYNPLQALRNRRLRARERRPLTAPVEAWQELQDVCPWIDEVEAATRDLDFRAVPDRVQLPLFVGEREDIETLREPPRMHRRTDTASTLITRPDNGWSIEPAELMADTYWTEKGDNKCLIENRHGNPIFPARVVRASVEQPRRSADTSRTLNDKQVTDSPAEDVHPYKSHKRTLLLPKRHKLLAPLTRTPSQTSLSSDEGRQPPVLAYGVDDSEENIGPLERHMQQMIAKEEKGELSSPDLVSPDHWESKHTQFPVLRGNTERSHRNTLSQGSEGNGRLSADVVARTHRRAKSADGRVGASDRVAQANGSTSSAEAISPVKLNFISSLGVEVTPPSAYWQSPKEHKSRLHKLPLFRSHSKDRNNIEQKDFANMPANGLLDPRSSQESSRPSYVQRHKTNESFPSSLRRQGTNNTSSGTNGSIKESGSTVGRFFKSGRIGDLVRNEGSRLGDRFRGGKDRSDEVVAGDAPLTDESDLEDVDPREPVIVADDDNDINPKDTKPNYHLQNLPSFISPRGRGGAVEQRMSTGSDPIPGQQKAQREAGRSPRFDKLAPPRISLPADDKPFSNELAVPDRPDTSSVGRKSYGYLGTGTQVTARNSVVSFDAPNERNSDKASDPRISKFKNAGKQRHWSISDRLPLPEQAPRKVTMRDIARVRALLLSSGIKAREIQRQADAPRDTPLPVFKCVADFVGQDMSQVIRRREHLVASKFLSESLDLTLSDYEGTLEHFQTTSARSLAHDLDELQRKAVDHLTKVVHETSDDADAFVVELTTKQPQDIKRVDDAIDEMLRVRRRQFRVLRRFGFKLLEWLVLGLMWWVWFVVVLFNWARRSVVVFVKVLRWLFWF
ncbi:hypothetical protein LTR08_005606 [Meristemomyces frigidus]|nr:hypothetical protein LTR08_005606 [Meristemomyces frigidus]